MPSLGIVVPAYRPEVDRLKAYLRSLDSTLSPEVLRIELDDPSPKTLEALTATDLPIEVAAVPYRRGKGAAVTAGFEALETDRLAFVDADGSTPAGELARIVDGLEDADLAIGSRRHPYSSVQGHQTFARRFLGDAFAWLARRLLDAHVYDTQCGAKAISREAWDTLRTHLYEPGFAWDVELVAMAAAFDQRIVEVPIEWEDHPGSTVSPVRTGLSMGRALIVTRHRAKRIKDSRLHHTIARVDTQTALVDRESTGIERDAR
ncbi:MAG: glycosyltransferase [Natronomonas sp.]